MNGTWMVLFFKKTKYQAREKTVWGTPIGTAAHSFFEGLNKCKWGKNNIDAIINHTMWFKSSLHVEKTAFKKWMHIYELDKSNHDNKVI